MKKFILLVMVFSIKALNAQQIEPLKTISMNISISGHAGYSMAPLLKYRANSAFSGELYQGSINQVNESNLEVKQVHNIITNGSIYLAPVSHQNFEYAIGLKGLLGTLMNSNQKEWSYSHIAEIGIKSVAFRFEFEKIKLRSTYFFTKDRESLGLGSDSPGKVGSFQFKDIKSYFFGIKYKNDDLNITAGYVLELYNKNPNALVLNKALIVKSHGFKVEGKSNNISFFAQMNFGIPIGFDKRVFADSPNLNSIINQERKLYLVAGFGFTIAKKINYFKIYKE